MGKKSTTEQMPERGHGQSSQNPAFNLPAKIGAATFIAQFFAVIAVLIGFLHYDNEWREHLAYILIGTLIIFGPIFVAIAFVTRRLLCRLHRFRHQSKS